MAKCLTCLYTYSLSIQAIFMKPLLLTLIFLMQGCTAIAIVDAAASTVVTAGKVVVKGTGAVVGAAIPDGDKDEDDE